MPSPLTVHDVAELLGVNVSTVLRWCSWPVNPLPHRRVKGNNILVSRVRLRDWLRRSPARESCDQGKSDKFIWGRTVVSKMDKMSDVNSKLVDVVEDLQEKLRLERRRSREDHDLLKSLACGDGDDNWAETARKALKKWYKDNGY